MKKRIVILFVFLTKVNEDNFDEELFYDKQRIFFIEACLSDTSVFNTMFNLHHKGKDNLNKIEDLIENPANVLERQKVHTEETYSRKIINTKENRRHR